MIAAENKEEDEDDDNTVYGGILSLSLIFISLQAIIVLYSHNKDCF